MKTINSTGIKLKFNADHGWLATVDFSTWQHANDACIEGSIGGRYFNQDLGKAVDLVLDAARTIGVVFPVATGVEPHVYVDGDGEDPSVELPIDWPELVQGQCDRLNWTNAYQSAADESQEAPSQVP